MEVCKELACITCSSLQLCRDTSVHSLISSSFDSARFSSTRKFLSLPLLENTNGNPLCSTHVDIQFSHRGDDLCFAAISPGPFTTTLRPTSATLSCFLKLAIFTTVRHALVETCQGREECAKASR